MQSLRIAYAGTPEFAVPALKAIIHSPYELVAVLTQPDRKSGRGRKISESAVKLSATSSNVQVLQPENVNDSEVLGQLIELNLDLLVVAAYGQIFSQVLLDIPRMGCINIHASLLPRWRGASPIQHAILVGDEVSGVSIMQMQKGMDAGDIWLQADCVIQDEDTSQSLHDKLAELGGNSILEAIRIVADGTIRPVPQDESKITYCSKLKKSDGLILWHEPAEIILRKIKAFHPWPGAYTTLNGRRLRITSAILSTETPPDAVPGVVTKVSKLGISVSTGQNTLVIKALVPEGSKQVSAVDFSNSNTLENQLLGETAE
mgnify:CR=1 FL=1|tara:strand:+ start:1538 stop:2488 length:951 start_codon:yes stop_codon:yes gene_type:complete